METIYIIISPDSKNFKKTEKLCDKLEKNIEKYAKTGIRLKVFVNNRKNKKLMQRYKKLNPKTPLPGMFLINPDEFLASGFKNINKKLKSFEKIKDEIDYSEQQQQQQTNIPPYPPKTYNDYALKEITQGYKSTGKGGTITFNDTEEQDPHGDSAPSENDFHKKMRELEKRRNKSSQEHEPQVASLAQVVPEQRSQPQQQSQKSTKATHEKILSGRKANDYHNYALAALTTGGE